jgi:hypothetical protein
VASHRGAHARAGTAARARTDSLQRALDDERRWAVGADRPGSARGDAGATPDGARNARGGAALRPASDRALLFAEGFAPPGSHDYELWAITGEGPTSLGVVHAGPGRAAPSCAWSAFARDGAVAAFAVSLEATGGSPDKHKPSGPVVMLGKLAG